MAMIDHFAMTIRTETDDFFLHMTALPRNGRRVYRERYAIRLPTGQASKIGAIEGQRYSIAPGTKLEHASSFPRVHADRTSKKSSWRTSYQHCSCERIDCDDHRGTGCFWEMRTRLPSGRLYLYENTMHAHAQVLIQRRTTSIPK